MNEFIDSIEVPANIKSIAVPTAPTGSTAGGGARAMITNPNDGTQVSRADYMKALAANGWTRPQILAHVREVSGDKSLRYQTVHQAVKEYFPKDERGTKAEAAAAGDATEEFED
jgi:hypothetical protein